MSRTLLAMSLVIAFFSVAVGQESHDAAKLFPPSTAVYVEFKDPKQLLATILEHPLRKKIESLPQYSQLTQTDQYERFRTGLRFIEANLAMPWREAVETLAAQGVYVGADTKTRGVALVVHGKDAKSMELLLRKSIAMAKLAPNAGSLQVGEYRGIKAYRMDKARFAVAGEWLIVTNNSDLGQQMADRVIDGVGDSLADKASFRSARLNRQTDATLWTMADIESIRSQGMAKPLFTGQSANPVIELLAGGILSTLRHTPQATVDVVINAAGISAASRMPHQNAWVAKERTYYFGANGQGVGPTLPAVGQTLFTLSTHRDVSDMWLRAGDLFDEKINDGFAQADAGLTTFFAGRDFGQDILGSFAPQFGFIATRQDFADVLPRPTIQLPAFAMVLELKEPKTMTRELRRTFQSMLGFFNVLGAMQGRPQLEMDIEKLENGAELITSIYIPEQDDRDSTHAPILFNFSPSIGFAGQRFVVASTKTLARELTVAAVPTETAIQDNTRMQVHANVLHQLLRDNRGQLIAQNMLSDGNSREQAEAIVELLLAVVSYIQDATLRLGTSDNELTVEFKLNVEH